MKNILLCCASGMSTSLLVKKMKQAAVKRAVDISIRAVPIAAFTENMASADIILLGPQVRYQQAPLQAIAQPLGKRVVVIDMRDYGLMDGDAVLAMALTFLET
ncbi:PTS sugar transporter subunit IIB [Edwardsiella piscicida]|uniref:PTS sugar transporter subunit IIB n=1 Tax=Edwardsiella piscicida TaxID=1263550 RepID=UPI00084C3D16|nr:PTS sugar transporter subunit IIB [Edwardsiella piscicida]UCQ30861.1 PTS sugar transporter subunit IIB [Edwardsiella piscicida]